MHIEPGGRCRPALPPPWRGPPATAASAPHHAPFDPGHHGQVQDRSTRLGLGPRRWSATTCSAVVVVPLGSRDELRGAGQALSRDTKTTTAPVTTSRPTNRRGSPSVRRAHTCRGSANSLLSKRGRARRRGLESTRGRLFGGDSHTHVHFKETPRSPAHPSPRTGQLAEAALTRDGECLQRAAVGSDLDRWYRANERQDGLRPPPTSWQGPQRSVYAQIGVLDPEVQRCYIGPDGRGMGVDQVMGIAGPHRLAAGEGTCTACRLRGASGSVPAGDRGRQCALTAEDA